MEYFIISYYEIFAIRSTANCLVADLIIIVSVRTFTIVDGWKIAITRIVGVAIIRNVKIMATSKCRSIAIVTIDKILIANWNIFLLDVKLKQISLFANITIVIVNGFIPSVESIASNSSLVFSANNSHSVIFIVALLMEGC